MWSALLVDGMTGMIDKSSTLVIVGLMAVGLIILLVQQFQDMVARIARLEAENQVLRDALQKQLKQEDVELRCRAYQTTVFKRFESIAMMTSKQCESAGATEASKQWAAFACNVRDELKNGVKSFDPALDHKHEVDEEIDG